MLFVQAFALFAVLVRAQEPSFQGQLNDARQAIFAALSDQRADAIEEGARQTQTLDGAVGQARWVVQDIRRRAAWIDPASGRDWFFEADLQRLRTDLMDLATRAKGVERLTAALAKDTPADPALAGAAERLAAAARGLRLESGRMADDARWAGHEVRRAGYAQEGDDVIRAAATTLMSAFHVEEAAIRLKKRCGS